MIHLIDIHYTKDIYLYSIKHYTHYQTNHVGDVDSAHFSFKLTHIPHFLPTHIKILYFYVFHFIQIVENGLLATTHQVTTSTFLIYKWINSNQFIFQI